MNCNEDVNLPVRTPGSGIRLTVTGLGHVPSFKNKKRAILDRKTGKMRTLTEPETKKWMERCIQSFEYQLLSAFLITEGGMQTVLSPHSWTASFLPLNDSVQWIPEITIRVEQVEKGAEGAIIEITRLT